MLIPRQLALRVDGWAAERRTSWTEDTCGLTVDVLAGVNWHWEVTAMSVGGAGPQVGFLVNLINWARDLFTGGRTKTLEDEQRRARQARIDEYHRRHPDASGSTAATTAHPDDQPGH